MKIVKASYEIMTPLDYSAILRHIELCGRVCYKSEERITNDSAETFVKQIIKRGHESVLEHFSFTVRFIVDRGVSHELVRHRITSFSQESTRYCNYGGGDVMFIKPVFWDEDHLDPDIRRNYLTWEMACDEAENSYLRLVKEGASAQEARSVLPNSAKTEVITTKNIRMWRDFFELRVSPAAHPQMREVTVPLLLELQETLPVFFEDIGG